MRGKLATEGIGTFFLVLVIGLAGSAPWGPVAIASGLAALVYMGREVSGAHYNPAVTLAVLLRRRISAAAAGAYAVVQLLGGVLGIGALPSSRAKQSGSHRSRGRRWPPSSS